ncbi:MAG: hypothetical protein Q4C37_07725 [Bacteroidales bacterium]|nr:hypothetical protein [Bacteroidales bacterium]
MKKKVLYGVVMACSLGMTMGTLQSCTDDLNDFKGEYVVDQYNLGQTLDGIKAEIAANKAQCEAEIARLQAQITANDGDIEKLQQDLTALAGQVADRVTYDQLTQTLTKLEQDLKAYVDSQDAALKAAIDSEIALAKAEIDKLDGKVSTIETKVGTLETNLAALQAKVNENKVAIDAINTELGNIQTNVQANKDAIAQLTEDFTELQKEYDAKLAEIDETLGIAFEQIEGAYAFTTLVWQIMEENDAALQDQIDGLLTSIVALEDQFDILTMRIDELITGILLQATDSPVFGNFSLPLGVQSNMLFNWFFENKGMGYTFPNAAPEYAYNTAEILDGGRDVVSAEDVATAIASKNSTFAVPEGYTDTFLGNLYMTINPIGHQVLDGKTFYLETSKGVEGRLPFTLDVKPSDEELMFGTRSVENGFYASEVVVPGEAEQIAAVKVNMDEKLKEAGKAVINERSKRALLNFLQAVYDQVNTSFPRYAVRAEWPGADKASRKMYSVLSNYDLGVATAKPLSYAFLDGKGTDHRLRHIGHIANLFYQLKENGDLHFSIDASGYHMDITIQAANQTYVGAKDIAIVVDGTTYYPESVDGINASINAGVKNALDKAGLQMTEDVNKQIDKIVADITSKVNGKIDSVLGQLGDKSEPWFQRLNKLVDLYNRVADKVNAFLAEPNEYLQPAMFYKTADGIGMVSNAKEDPTVFVNGGGPAFVLYPSSYTAEVVAPAYKKMIACINVIDNATGNYVANGRDLAKQFNATSDGLAVVLEGSTYCITVPGAAVKSGYTYEIMYQALDYSGVTSTRKFYIKVK